ncbi:MAG: hypothetical protein JSV04_06065, partial [Candidatus Heimdallarchaeota archaeon]
MTNNVSYSFFFLIFNTIREIRTKRNPSEDAWLVSVDEKLVLEVVSAVEVVHKEVVVVILV